MAGEMLNNLGVIYIKQGLHEEALQALDQARGVFQEAGDREREMQVVGNMGDLYASLDDIEQATLCYRQAADSWQEMGDDERYGRTLMALGEMQFKKGQRQEGLATYQTGLECIKDPTFRQRMILRLRGLQARLLGG
jgi:tetratricopeptide (TPR) repeat protein